MRIDLPNMHMHVVFSGMQLIWQPSMQRRMASASDEEVWQSCRKAPESTYCRLVCTVRINLMLLYHQARLAPSSHGSTQGEACWEMCCGRGEGVTSTWNMDIVDEH